MKPGSSEEIIREPKRVGCPNHDLPIRAFFALPKFVKTENKNLTTIDIYRHNKGTLQY